MAIIISRNEKKELINYLKERYSLEDFKFNFDFLRSGKEKVWIIPPEFNKINLDKMRIEFVGSYFGSYDDKYFRLSVEACQLIGPFAKKNFVELDEENLNKWIHGKNILEFNSINLTKGYVLIKNKKDFYGSGKFTGNIILNMLAKNRRIKD